jgi:RimJ/RimL family protein N-acetyltransferase
MNTELIEQNVHRLLGAMTGAATTATVAVGDQLGLYRALAGGGPATQDELTARAGRDQAGTLLAAAKTTRRARQARRHRQAGHASGPRTSPLRRLPPWLQLGLSLRLARPPSPAAEGTQAVLRDGSTVLIRQVRGTDAPLLADGFARLSPRSRQMRFLGPKTMLSAAELRYFTEVDHHDHEAIGALSGADGRGVGIARYVRDADDPQAAEIAVTIVDEWQGRGLGTELLSRLSDLARQAGINRFTALVSTENAASAGLLRNLGACLAGRGPGTMEYELALEPADYSLDWWTRRADVA